MSSLFNLGLEYRALSELINDVEFDETTGEVINNSSELEELFNNLNDELSLKLNGCKFVLEENDNNARLLREMSKKFTKKAVAIDNRNKALRELMVQTLEQVPDNKVKTDLFSFSIRNTKSVNIVDNDVISREYLKMKFDVDKVKIGKALKEGKKVEGAKLTESKYLNIK